MQQAHFVFALFVGLITSFSSISNADEWTDPNKKPNSITLGTQLFGQEIDLSKPSLVNFWDFFNGQSQGHRPCFFKFKADDGFIARHGAFG